MILTPKGLNSQRNSTQNRELYKKLGMTPESIVTKKQSFKVSKHSKVGQESQTPSKNDREKDYELKYRT